MTAQKQGVSFITTLYNKQPYLDAVCRSLQCQEGEFDREFVFVDDGSDDNTAEELKRLTASWDNVAVVEQVNAGAADAHNVGAARASMPFLKFLDGDDVLTPRATTWLLDALEATGAGWAWGNLGKYSLNRTTPDGITSPTPVPKTPPSAEVMADPLAFFIRNIPANSTSLLVEKALYDRVGGCDERLRSPDYTLFLRLAAAAPTAHVAAPVGLVPMQAPGRLSGQKRRSRYESVLALRYLVAETHALSPTHRQQAMRRAVSRAWLFARRENGCGILSSHFLRLVRSRLPWPVNAVSLITASLAAFTEDGRIQRPIAWRPPGSPPQPFIDGDPPATVL